jgi:hypothetical protein
MVTVSKEAEVVGLLIQAIFMHFILTDSSPSYRRMLERLKQKLREFQFRGRTLVPMRLQREISNILNNAEF